MFRSAFVPRAAGGARPTFFLFKGLAFNGVDQLDPNLTINGQTVTPSLRYKGGDADGTDWAPWIYGGNTELQVGTAPTLNDGSPLLGSNDDSVCFNEGGYYLDPGNTIGDITTEDMVVEIVLKKGPVGNLSIAGKRSGDAGWTFDKRSGGEVRFLLDNGIDAPVTLISAALSEGWIHILIFANKSEGSANGGQLYINGVASGSGADFSALGSITSAASLAIGSRSDGVFDFDSEVAYLAMWQLDAWHQEGASGPAEWATIAKERFNRLIGIYPQVAKGTAIPTLQTRATAAYLDKLEDSNTTRKLYQVGPGWMRVVSRLDDASEEIQGYLPEISAENKALQSEDLDTTWAQIDAGDSVGGSVEVPNKTTSVTAGLIPDATDGPHGVSQAVTVTAATWAFSVWGKRGDTDWLLIDNDTIANGKAWFDLNNGVVGTTQAGIIDADIHDYGDGWFRCEYIFTGTAAAHSLEIRMADADNDTAYSEGDGVGVGLYAWGAQCELADHHTSYIPTTTVAVTRNADLLQYKGDDGSIKDTGVGHLEVTILKGNQDSESDQYITNISDGGAAGDRISLFERSIDDVALLETRAASGNQGDALGSSDLSDGIKHDIIASWNTDSVGVAVDSVHEGGDDSASTPDALDEIDIGMDAGSANQFNGVIGAFTLFAKALLKGSIGESFMSHLGCTYISSSAGEGVVAGTFEKVAGTYTAGDLVDFTHSTGVLTYTGLETKTFLVFSELTCASGASNPLLRFRLAKNGTSIAASEISRKMGTAADRGAMGLTWCIELAQGDTVELQYTDDASSTLTAHLATLLAVAA